MSQITIRFDLKQPRFAHAFIWDGDEEAAAEHLAEVDRAAQSQGMTAGAFMLNAIVHAPELLRHAESVAAEAALKAIAGFVLRQPTRHPDHPGLIGDHVATTDFEYTVTRIHDGKIEGRLEATPSVAGSA
jgi:hypothetical protein